MKAHLICFMLVGVLLVAIGIILTFKIEKGDETGSYRNENIFLISLGFILLGTLVIFLSILLNYNHTTHPKMVNVFI
jgi:Ca2+/Na+ antiporter